MRPMALAERDITMPTVRLAALLQGDRPALGGATRLSLTDYADEITRSGSPGAAELRRTSPSRPARRLRRPHRGERVRRAWQTGTESRRAAQVAHRVCRRIVDDGVLRNHPRRRIRRRIRQTGEDDHSPLSHRPGTTVDHRAASRLGADEEPAAATRCRPRAPARRSRVGGSAARCRHRGAGRRAPRGASHPREGTLLGALFESLVTLSVRTYAQANEARVGHLRTRGGEREIDLVVERRDGRVVALEVKLSATVDDATPATSRGSASASAPTCSTPPSSPPATRPTGGPTASASYRRAC